MWDIKWQLQEIVTITSFLGGKRLSLNDARLKCLKVTQINNKQTGDASIRKPIGSFNWTAHSHHYEKLWLFLLILSLLLTLHYSNTKIRRKEGRRDIYDNFLFFLFFSHWGLHETAGFAFYRIDIILHTNKPGQF